MHVGIMFDKSSSSWEKDFEFNKIFARAQLMYIRDRYRANGFIYLNTIYEKLVLNGIRIMIILAGY